MGQRLNRFYFQAAFFFAALAVVLGAGHVFAQVTSVEVVLDEATSGSFTVDPPLPADGKYPLGTVVTVSATPAAGYVLDSGYYSIPGRWGAMYHETMHAPFEVMIDKEDMHIGVSFIEASEVEHINVTQNVVYGKPGVKTLKYDVFSPKGANNLPIIVIVHGGGWATNTEDIMRGLARELTRGGKFVVASIDYRWAARLDGDEKNNTMANIIEDVFGAVAHIIEHAKEYGGDPSRVGITGDSAGGHLSAVASLMPNMIGDAGFGKTAGVFEFMPTYMPSNKSVDDVRDMLLSSIKAAAPSYGVFGGPFLNHYSEDPAADSTWQAAISPINYIPKASVRAVPQYLTRGTRDPLISDEMVSSFTEALVDAGQRVQYVQVGGANHAFFDWKPDQRTKDTFKKYGVYYAAEMKAFFESVLY